MRGIKGGDFDVRFPCSIPAHKVILLLSVCLFASNGPQISLSKQNKNKHTNQTTLSLVMDIKTSQYRTVSRVIRFPRPFPNPLAAPTSVVVVCFDLCQRLVLIPSPRSSRAWQGSNNRRQGPATLA